ncbi:hypothetical protein [Actinomadura rupiterrae]|uniref:hypothetical protein n=1 Tax=Actinomadura rupiterrae TaxID=559627 RepID=UPI0020A47AC0|nr:hypothetical protein [Actinomadura rupiterrae]MCP2334788.1 Spy/CpxP family protein refolding chaperone [Actinomadura rupiterrae]
MKAKRAAAGLALAAPLVIGILMAAAPANADPAPTAPHTIDLTLTGGGASTDGIQGSGH